MFIFLIALAVIITDQISKNLIRNGLAVGDSIPVISDFFHITHVENTGAAFSMLEGQYLITIGVPIILIIICIVYLRKHKNNMHITLKLAMPLIMGGGLGNLYDRVVFGYVTDMFDFRVFPVFNVADIAVCVGCALLAIYVLFFEEEKDKDAEV